MNGMQEDMEDGGDRNPYEESSHPTNHLNDAIMNYINAFAGMDESELHLCGFGDPSDGMAFEVHGSYGMPSGGRAYRKNPEYIASVGLRSSLNQIKGEEMSGKKVVFNTEGFDLEHLQMMRNLLNDAIFQVEEDAKKPKEPEGEDGTIISFQKRFNGRQVYLYAGLKARGGWSITGQSGLNGIGWERLLNFIRDKESNPQRAIDTIKVVFTA